MGLMDKFKNLFTDEEIIEEDDDEEVVEIKEVKKEEPKLPTFMREKIAKEEKETKKEETQVKDKIPQIMKIEPNKELEKEVKVEYNLIDDDSLTKKEDSRPTFKFPIDLNDTDFNNSRTSRQSLHASENNNKVHPGILNVTEKKQVMSREKNEKKPLPPRPPVNDLKVAELYKDKKTTTDKKTHHFKATPIISPIYGVLDKNYNPSEVENNIGLNFEDSRPSKNVDFDSVRKKAYGSLTDEIKENLMCENCEYLKEAKECQKRKEQEKNKKKCKNKKEVEESNTGLMSDKTQYYNEPVANDYYNQDYQDITLDEAAENYYDYGVEYEKQVPEGYDDGYNNPDYTQNYVNGYPESYDQTNIENNVETNIADNSDGYYLENEVSEVPISNHVDEESVSPRKKEIPPVKSSINLLSTLKKSMGEESVSSPPIDTPKEEKNLELTDDLFNLIDSMYDERNDNE